MKTASAGKKSVQRSSTEECTEDVEEAKIAGVTLTKNIHKCSSCTLYIVLLSIIFTINVGISSCFIYFHCCLKKDVIRFNFGTRP